jgi:hypothetical protein
MDMNPTSTTNATTTRAARCARRALVLLLVGVAVLPAMAQGGGKKDRIMTREELRACMKRSEALKTGSDELLTGRRTLDVEKADIAKERDGLDQQVKAIAAERDTVDKADETAVKAYNDKANAMIATYNTRKGEIDAKVDGWNARNRAHNERAMAQEQELKSYNDDCATRRFREDDEKAIRAGK